MLKKHLANKRADSRKTSKKNNATQEIGNLNKTLFWFSCAGISYLFIIIFIDFIMYFIFKNRIPDISALINKLSTLLKGDCAPEYIENLLFRTTVFCAPFVALLVSAIFFSKKPNLNLKPRVIYAYNAFFFVATVGFLLVLLSYENFYYFSGIFKNVKGLGSALALFVLFALLYKYKKDFAYKPLIIFFGIVCLWITAFNTVFAITPQSDIFEARHHFSAYVTAIVNVFYGKTMLIDTNAQYGFYPYLLLPIFKTIGLTGHHISIVMNILKIAAYISIFSAVFLFIKNKLLAILININIVYFCNATETILIGMVEQYFMVMPHRFLFPYISIFVVALYIKFRFNSKIRTLVLGGMILESATAFLWNMETALLSFASCFFALAFCFLIDIPKYDREHIFIKANAIGLSRVVFFLFSAPLIAWGAFQTITYARSGVFINVFESIKFINTYYNAGFGMLPMPLQLHPWMLISFIYLVGIFISVRGLYLKVTKNAAMDNLHIFIFFISIIGTGMFTYYQGRSHDLNLQKIIAPSLILVGLYIEIICEKFKDINGKRKIPIYGAVYVVVFVLFLQPATFIFDIQTPIAKIRAKNKYAGQTNVEWLDYVGEDEDVIVLANVLKEAHYLLHLKRANYLDGPSVIEAYFQDEVDKKFQDLYSKKTAPIIIDADYPWWGRVSKHLKENYYLKWTNPEKQYMVFRPLSELGPEGYTSRQELKIAEYDSLITKLRVDSEGFIYESPNTAIGSFGLPQPMDFNLPSNYIIEFSIMPREETTNNATLIRLADAQENFFSFEQFGTLSHQYSFAVGNGDKRGDSTLFYMSPNEWHRVQIYFGSENTWVGIDGEEYFNAINLSTSIPHPSGKVAINFGDWASGGRQFNGKMRDIRFYSLDSSADYYDVFFVDKNDVEPENQLASN